VNIWLLTLVLFIFLTPAVGLSQQKDTAAEIRELREKLERLERKMADEEAKRKAETRELERKTKTLAEEFEKKKLEEHIPELAEIKPQYGLGPAASKVYAVTRGLSLAAYGEMNYRKFLSDIGSSKDQSDFLRFVTYVGYKFNDWMLLNSEIEYEHGSTSDTGSGAGEVSVEFAYVDFLLSQRANARVGMVLAPMGLLNEYHEPIAFHGALRPDVETHVLPTTWRGNGAGLFGEILPGLQYRTYIMEGLRASRFRKDGIRNGRQKGNRSLFEDPSWAFRLDYTPNPHLLVGGSFFMGNQGQDQTIAGDKPDAFMTLWDLHGQFRYRGLELRALGAIGALGDAAKLSAGASAANRPIASQTYGWYLEAAYDVLPLLRPGTTQYLAPFFRFERYNTQWRVPSGFTPDRSKDRALYTVGISYKPVPNVVLKADYRNYDANGPSNVADEFAFGLGFAF
jgi:hypothetical protein